MNDSTNRPLAVVTGASSGIGLALAREFADHGFDLVLAAEDAGIDEASTPSDRGYLDPGGSEPGGPASAALHGAMAKPGSGGG